MILAIDQGTSATKACLFEADGELLGSASVGIGRRETPGGGVVQDPRELVRSCEEAARGALRSVGVKLSEIEGAALANQGESFLLLGLDGSPRTPVINWADTTGAAAVDRLEEAGEAEWIRARTGLPLHAMFPGPKIAHHRAPLGREALCFATLDTWLIHELDQSHPFLTDRATASRTMLVALERQDWDPELLERFDVPREMLPEIVPCDKVEATLTVDGESVPLWASGYDMGVALLGQGCLSPGQTKASFGTCLGVMASTGLEPAEQAGLLTAIAYTSRGKSAFALDGEIAACGALVAWALKLGIAASVAELEQLAASVESSRGMVVVPAIQGLGAPHWRDDLKASIVGMTGASGRAELARAVLDALAFSLADVIEAIRSAGLAPSELRVDGGLASRNWLMQHCADVTGMTLVRSAQADATAYGVAALAGLGRRLIGLEDVGTALRGGHRFDPRADRISDEARIVWAEAIEAATER